MTVLKTKDVVSGLLKKGFKKSESDHTFLILYVDDKKTSIRTKVSHGAREIGDNLIGMMAKQLRIDKTTFRQLVDCVMTRQDYLNELAKQGIVFK